MRLPPVYADANLAAVHASLSVCGHRRGPRRRSGDLGHQPLAEAEPLGMAPPGYLDRMGKQMEGDNKQRRNAAREAREAGDKPSEHGMTTGGSKGPSGTRSSEEHLDKLAETQRGEAKQAGRDVPGPLRGKGRQQEPKTPPGP
jgi:hypothetical protein